MSHLYRRPKKDGIYWLAFYKNSKLCRKSLKTKDRETANYLKSKIEQEVAENKYITYESNPACKDILEKYEAASQHHKAAKTISDDKERIQSFLSWGGINKISQITEDKLQDYLTHRINDNKVTLTTANRIISSIKAWLNFAERRKYIFNNPLRHFKKYKPPENLPKFLTKEEVHEILNKARDTRLYPAIVTAIYTGMRKGELFNLEWQDIDFNRNVISIRNRAGFTTKSKKARAIPLHNNLREVLLLLKKDSGKCFDGTNYKHLFPRIIENTNLKDKDVGWHHFRHTFASHLCLEGVDLYTVCQILGHSSIEVTQIYAHLTKDHIKTAIDKLNF